MIFDTLLERRATKVSLGGPSSKAIERFLLGNVGDSTPVDETTALNYSAVYAAVRLLSETIASLPLPTYERLKPRGKKRAPDHPNYPILHDRANDETGSFDFFETLGGHVLTWGNGYAEIERVASGRPAALWQLRPDRVHPDRTGPGTDRRLIYRVEREHEEDKTFEQRNILHWHGLGFDGIVGYSPIAMARRSIELGMNAEIYGAKFFKNDATPSGVLEYPGVVGKGKDNLRETWEELHRGADRAKRIAILEEGMKFHQIGIPPEDAQFLGTREFQVGDIARWYNLPPHMIGDLRRATFSNIEHMGIQFVVYSLRPWLKRGEQEINFKLFPASERRRFFAEFLVDGLLRGDQKARSQSYMIGRQWGWLNADDIREFENQNPLPDKQGEVYIVPMNFQNADALVSKPDDEDESEGQEQARKAFGVLIDAELRRARKREIAAVRRAECRYFQKGKADGFLPWAEKFYEGHEQYLAEALAIVVEASGQVLADVGWQPEQIAGDHCQHALRSLKRANGAVEVIELTEQWEAADAIAKTEAERKAGCVDQSVYGE